MTLPPEFAAYQVVYDALPSADQRQVDTGILKSERALNFLIGRVMQQTQGRANPQVVRALIVARLEAAPIETST
jgi:Asp-tRNA(Asn)/Glu-tRNA(Gln) amidotransferase B subunit